MLRKELNKGVKSNYLPSLEGGGAGTMSFIRQIERQRERARRIIKKLSKIIYTHTYLYIDVICFIYDHRYDKCQTRVQVSV